MHLGDPKSAIVSAIIFNALIIPALVPLALKGVRYRAIGATALLRRNLLIYGLGGMILPFVGIKLIDLIVHNVFGRVSRSGVRGRYRILLGMAAGVGKTYRMLQEGQQARARRRRRRDRLPRAARPARDRGARRGARERAAPAEPPRRLELAEMDVDAVIARKPELALVDELAHTNLPEARNAKRYEDIDEILEAGIDVTSTVNIQHLESLNDAVFELTGVRVRETFPDRILDEADEVVLVDLDPGGAAGAAPRRQGLRARAGRGRARELLPARQPRRPARARAARARRGRRGAPQHSPSSTR